MYLETWKYMFLIYFFLVRYTCPHTKKLATLLNCTLYKLCRQVCYAYLSVF